MHCIQEALLASSSHTVAFRSLAVAPVGVGCHAGLGLGHRSHSGWPSSHPATFEMHLCLPWSQLFSRREFWLCFCNIVQHRRTWLWVYIPEPVRRLVDILDELLHVHLVISVVPLGHHKSLAQCAQMCFESTCFSQVLMEGMAKWPPNLQYIQTYRNRILQI